jgi:hypothetical protein
MCSSNAATSYSRHGVGHDFWSGRTRRAITAALEAARSHMITGSTTSVLVSVTPQFRNTSTKRRCQAEPPHAPQCPRTPARNRPQTDSHNIPSRRLGGHDRQYVTDVRVCASMTVSRDLGDRVRPQRYPSVATRRPQEGPDGVSRAGAIGEVSVPPTGQTRPLPIRRPVATCAEAYVWETSFFCM